MLFLFYQFLFLFGACVGSFLNVVIRRLDTGEEPVKKRSHCPQCGHILAWYDLIPVVSFFVLRGQCRYCKESISWQYPAVEAATGLLFVAVYQFGDFGFGILNLFRISDFGFRIFSFCFLLYVTCSLIVIFVYDLRHYLIPDKVLWPAVGVALVYRFFEVLDFGNWDLFGFWKLGFGIWQPLWPYFLSALSAAAFFLFLVLITRGRGMGVGDVKLVFLLGLLLGWPQILIALMLAFGLGALVGLVLIAAGKKTLKSAVPFGPFLVLGALIALFWGEQLLSHAFF